MRKFPNVAYVLGNGKSRLKYDLNQLQSEGAVIGCNAIYRDFPCDYLVATDCHITSEIVAAGYSRKNKCYFRDRIPHPAEYKEMLKYGMERVIDYHTNEPYFVAIGLTDVDSDKHSYGSELLIFGLHEDDVSEDLKVIGCDTAEKTTMEFAGANAIDVACHLEGGKYDTIMMIGFDFGTPDGMVNNVYTGTTSYTRVGSPENPKLASSVYELDRVIKENPTRRFVMANPNPPEKLQENKNFYSTPSLEQDREQWIKYLDNLRENGHLLMRPVSCVTK